MRLGIVLSLNLLPSLAKLDQLAQQEPPLPLQLCGLVTALVQKVGGADPANPVLDLRIQISSPTYHLRSFFPAKGFSIPTATLSNTHVGNAHSPHSCKL